MIDDGTREMSGQRAALPALFALALLVALALASPLSDAPESAPVPEPALSGATEPAASATSLATEAPRAPRTGEHQVLEIERALVSDNQQQRETAFNVLLPELLTAEPARVIELVARQQGEARDALRDEVVRLWIVEDRDAALVWIGSFEDERERHASATIAVRRLAAIEPAQAIAVADQFGIGRDDGSVEHLVQIWATENPQECMKWLEAQPGNAQTAQLRARVEQVIAAGAYTTQGANGTPST